VSYYPFGLILSKYDATITDYSKNKYLYNGKEYEDDSFGSSSLNWYDYGARFYDAQIGRFTTIDPLAEKYHSISTFAYCFNNPIRFIDPDGRSATNYDDEKGNRLLTTNDGNNSTITVNKDKRLNFDTKVSAMEQRGTLVDKKSNVELNDAVTPATEGVFFTDKQMAWMYMDNNSVENIAWTTSGGVIVEPTKTFNYITGTYYENTRRRAYFSLPQGQKGSSLFIRLKGNDYNAISFVHDHPYVSGGMNDLSDKFSGDDGDIGIYKSYQERGVQMNMYLIGPKDVVLNTPQNPNKVVGSHLELLNGGNIIK
jgi:RHS repeat-associated protein